jgi:probable HAF family extracellular repeat protein
MNAEQRQASARRRQRNAGARLALGTSLALACWPPEVSVSSAPAGMERDTVSGVGSEMPAPPGSEPMSTPPAGEGLPPLQAPMRGGSTAVQPGTASADAGSCGLQGGPCCDAPAAACDEASSCDAQRVCVSAADAGGTPDPAALCGGLGQPCCTDGTRSCATGLGCSAASASCVTCGSLQNLGFFPGATAPYSVAMGVSSDGSVVVGTAADNTGLNRAFRWTAAAGMVDLGDPPGISERDAHSARTVSTDGGIIFGDSNVDFQPFRWTAAGGMRDLGTLPGGEERWHFVTAASADGQVMVGYEQEPTESTFRGFRWTQQDGLREVPGLPGAVSTVINGVSSDGRVLVGWSDNEAIYWTQADGTRTLPRPATVQSWYASNVNADGSILVGGYQMAGTRTGAARWNGSASPDFFEPGGQGIDISGDGSIVVGLGQQGAFLWEPTAGSREVASLVSISGFLSLDGANAISDDGRVLVGYGTNTLNFTEGWVADFGAAACSPP